MVKGKKVLPIIALVIALGFCLFAFPGVQGSFCLAQGEGEEEFTGVDLTIEDVRDMVIGFACWLISIVFALMVIALIVAGVRFFLVRGDSGAATNAKKNFTWVIIGIIVILGTNVIIASVANIIGADYSFIPLQCGGSGGNGGENGNVGTRVIYGTCTTSADCAQGTVCESGYCINP